MPFVKFVSFIFLLSTLFLSGCVTGKDRSFSALEQVHYKTKPELEAKLAETGLKVGDPVYIRAFKSEMQLETWVLNKKTGQYDLFKTYPICRASGTLGPKLKEGDKQAPEGFYYVTAQQLNPNSKYYLSFNLGYPNAYDRAQGRTGNHLMVHGSCVSAGCLAMNDQNIGEIYLMVEESLKNGEQAVPVHIFPFRMTREKMALREYSTWYDFWDNLKEGYDMFETFHVPPQVDHQNKRYVFDMQKNRHFALSEGEASIVAQAKLYGGP